MYMSTLILKLWLSHLFIELLGFQDLLFKVFGTGKTTYHLENSGLWLHRNLTMIHETFGGKIVRIKEFLIVVLRTLIMIFKN